MSSRLIIASFRGAPRIVRWLCLTVALLAAGCGDAADMTEVPGLPGDLQLAITVKPGVTLAKVTYDVTKPNGGPYSSGDIAVEDASATASLFLGQLPAGANYEARFSAVSVDGRTTCDGKAMFDIVAGSTTAVSLRMDCRTFTDRGGIAVVVTTNFCPRITWLVIGPTTAAFGKTIGVAAQVIDDDGPAPAVLWTATGGHFGNTAASSTTYTCTTSGPQTLTLTVSDGSCADTMVGHVNCGSCGTADVDGNGVLDCEENVIKNGEFVSDAAGWSTEAGVSKEFFSLDGLANPASGSLRVANAVAADASGSTLAGVNQCVVVASNTAYLLLNQVFIPVSQPAGFAATSLFFYGTPDCTGAILNVFTSPTTSLTNTWSKVISRPVAPLGTRSALVRLTVGKAFRQPPLQVLFDNVLLRPDP